MRSLDGFSNNTLHINIREQQTTTFKTRTNFGLVDALADRCIRSSGWISGTKIFTSTSENKSGKHTKNRNKRWVSHRRLCAVRAVDCSVSAWHT